MAMNEFERHGCGGQLVPTTLTFTRKLGILYFAFPIEGMRCNTCQEELISRNTAVKIEDILKSEVETPQGLVWSQIVPTVIVDIKREHYAFLTAKSLC
jgi:hypothetical protein